MSRRLPARMLVAAPSATTISHKDRLLASLQAMPPLKASMAAQLNKLTLDTEFKRAAPGDNGSKDAMTDESLPPNTDSELSKEDSLDENDSGIFPVRKIQRDGVVTTPALDIDWIAVHNRLFLESNMKMVTFALIVPSANGVDRRIEFELTPFMLVLPGYSKEKCVSITIHEYDKRPSISINSLFYGLDEDERKACYVKPSITPGTGDAVLELAFILSLRWSIPLSVSDDADFVDGKIPLVQANGMTPTLALLRGYGFYEARGFIPAFLDEHIRKNARSDQFTDTDNESDRRLMNDWAQASAVMQLNLTWTHVIVTTPLNELLDAIKAFPKKHAVLISAAPVLLQLIFSEKNMERHAGECKKEFLETFFKWLDHLTILYSSSIFGQFSTLRGLATAVNDGGVVLGEFLDDFNDAMDRAMKFARGIDVTGIGLPPIGDRYPNNVLTKHIYVDKNSDMHVHLVCKPAALPGGVPLVDIRQLRRDLLVEPILPSRMSHYRNQ